MKKLILGIIATVMFVNCTNESTINEVENSNEISQVSKAYIEKASIEEKNEYKKYHLLQVANWVSKNNSLLELKNEILSLSKTNSLTNDKILVKDIVSNLIGKNKINQNDKSFIEMQTSLNAFSGIENIDWQPAIEIKMPDKLENARTLDTSLPIYILESEDTNSLVTEAYQPDEEGNLELLDSPISESDAGSSPLVYMSIINETNTNTPNNPNYIYLRINQMKVKQHKEDWFNGRSEVNIVGFLTEENPQGSGDCGYNMTGGANCYNSDGRQIVHLRRRKVGDDLLYDYVLNNFTSNNTGSVVNFVIFEQDSWPAPEREVSFDYPNNTHRNIKYHSWQTYYIKSQVSTNTNSVFPYAYGYQEETSGIKIRL